VFLGDNLISWSSKRQTTVSRSSIEAEYRAVANGVAEACWLRQLLEELRNPLTKSTLVYCDNVSAVYLSTNPVQHQRRSMSRLISTSSVSALPLVMFVSFMSRRHLSLLTSSPRGCPLLSSSNFAPASTSAPSTFRLWGVLDRSFPSIFRRFSAY
jgi:hypothetical protein